MYKFLAKSSIFVYCQSLFAKTFLPVGYSTIMLFFCIFSKQVALRTTTLNHENIHRAQYLDCLVLGTVTGSLWLLLHNKVVGILLLLCTALLFFYLLYLIEYVIAKVYHWFISSKDCKDKQSCSYYSCAMEMEAYLNQSNADYLNHRKSFAWFKHYGKLTKDTGHIH